MPTPTPPPPPTPPPTRAMAGAALSLRGVGKAFGGKAVLDGCDLEIAAGQFVVVIGESGCGKSTLLRLVAGLEAPDRGEIVRRLPAGVDRAAETRLVFQEPRLLPWARVGANVAIGLPAGLDAPDEARRIEAVLAEVGLARRAGDWPSVLSGGEKQRVALARALVTTPDLLLFDEPLGALDALTRLAMQALIGRVWAALGFTALFVTHDVGEAVALADRVLVLAGGRIALDLPVPLDRPRERSRPHFGELEAVLLDAIFSAPAGARR